MRMRLRPRRRSVWGRHDHWPAIGLAGAILLLTGCSFSQTPGTTSGSGGVTPGRVTVAPSKSQYGPNATVDVTIANGLSSTIFATDHQSNCTVLVMEHWTGQTWQLQNPCRLMTPTRLVPFGAGTAVVQQLQSPTGPNTSGWPTGSYRIAYTYRQAPSEPETTVYSAQFTIA